MAVNLWNALNVWSLLAVWWSWASCFLNLSAVVQIFLLDGNKRGAWGVRHLPLSVPVRACCELVTLSEFVSLIKIKILSHVHTRNKLQTCEAWGLVWTRCDDLLTLYGNKIPVFFFFFVFTLTLVLYFSIFFW